MLPIHKQVYKTTALRFSKEAEVDILPIARWFREETITYIRVFGRISSSHVLPYYVPDKLMTKEIAYQIVGEGGLSKGLKEQKKAICPTFPLQCGVFVLHDFRHACKEVEIMKSLKLATIPGWQYDPNDTTEDFTTMVKVKPFTHEEDTFDDLFIQKESISEVTHMESLLFSPDDVDAVHVYIKRRL